MKNLILITLLTLFVSVSCKKDRTPDSDDLQRKQQEQMLQEATQKVGMPAINNNFERQQLKNIFELRDQTDLSTYTYLMNEMTGELRFFCNSIGYGIPYATQFTNPMKLESEWDDHGYAMATLPQADPNGLFSPASAEGTWVLCIDPHGTETKPVYVEPRIVTSPFRMELTSPPAEKPTVTVP